MDTNQLVKIDGGRKQIAIGNLNGALSAKGTPVGARVFVAATFGVAAADIKGMKMPAVKELCVANGATDESFKLARKSYDKAMAQFWTDSRKITALFSADPNYRQTIRPTKTGAVTTFRYVKPAASAKSANAQVAQLKALLTNAGIALPTELA